MQLSRQGGRAEGRQFTRRFRFQPENAPLTELRFARSAIYAGFSRLEKQGLVKRVETAPLTFEVVDEAGVSQAVFTMWQNVFPPQPHRRRRHKNDPTLLRQTLRETSDNYLRLRRRHGPEFTDTITEHAILELPLRDAVSTKELMTLHEAQALRSKQKNLLKQDRFIREEQKAKEVPLKSRPAHWRKPGWRKPHLLPQSHGKLEVELRKPVQTVSLAEHPLCPECHVVAIFDKKQGGFFCPECGLECQTCV